jgi:hypothetical protein
VIDRKWPLAAHWVSKHRLLFCLCRLLKQSYVNSTSAPPLAKLQICWLKIRQNHSAFVLMIRCYLECLRDVPMNEILGFTFPAAKLVYKRVKMVTKHVDVRRHMLLSNSWRDEQNIAFFVAVDSKFHWKTVFFYNLKTSLQVYRQCRTFKIMGSCKGMWSKAPRSLEICFRWWQYSALLFCPFSCCINRRTGRRMHKNKKLVW